MENIAIYSDESNHDTSITLKNDILNIDRLDGSREYVRSYLTINEKNLDDFLSKFIESENSLRISNSKSYEIKAARCLKISGRKGISQVEEKYIRHLNTLFSLLNNLDTTCTIVSCNKIEYVVKKSIDISIDRIKRNYPSYSDELNIETIIYTYSKYIQNYYTENLLKPLFSIESNANYKITKELRNINRELKQSSLKNDNYKIGDNLIRFIDGNFVGFDTKLSYPWDYSLESELFLRNYDLNENGTRYSFIFDAGTKFKNVFESMLYEVGNDSIVKNDDSQSETMLRVVDWLATFFGKLLRSYSNSFKMDKQEDKQIVLNTVHEIKDEWFDLTEEQFILFKVINKYLSNNKLFFLGGVLSDNILGIKNYIEYISSYETFEEFNLIPSYIHGRESNRLLNSQWDTFYNEKNIYFDSNDTTKGITYEHYIKINS